MHELAIICESCRREYPFRKTIFRCSSCGSSLEVRFDYSGLRRSLSLEKLRSRPFGHSRYLELFPVKSLVSLGEGGTPLLRSKNIERELGLKSELWFKCESQNPTGSFKDRGSSVEVARANLSGAVKAVVASTGNMGASLSAYSAVAGLECHVFTPSDARPVKLRQILAYGSRVHQVNGDYTLAASLAERASQESGAYLLWDYLFRREGTKSVGFEIADQLPGTTHVFTPVGNGTLVSALWKSFREWKELGFSRTLPRLAGIQASGCSPVTRAMKTGKPLKPVHGKTIAVAIECGDPLDGPRALTALKESKGLSESVTDREILGAREMLSRREGLFTEPAGAASLAGLINSRKRIPRGSRVVCILTGHGLKAPFTPIKGKPSNMGKKTDLRRMFG
jgi:threonine synthase